MDSLLLDVKESSNYLNIKEKTIYSKIKAGEIIHYRIGRLIRIEKSDLDAWLASKKKGPSDKKAIKRIKLKESSNSPQHIDKIIRKIIDQESGNEYTPCHGKPDDVNPSSWFLS